MLATTKRSTALYGHLSNPQKAALCFQLLCNQDEEEARRVMQSAERFTYRMTDAEFYHWHNAFGSLVALFAIMYWRIESRRAYAVGALISVDLCDHLSYAQGRTLDEEKGSELLELSRTIGTQQAALVAAMQEHCKQYRLDWNAVLLFADIAPECLPKEAPHTDWLERYRKELGELLPSL